MRNGGPVRPEDPNGCIGPKSLLFWFIGSLAALAVVLILRGCAS